MTDAQFNSSPQFNKPTNTSSSFSKPRKTIGECPTCGQGFTSRSELQSHMEDPPNHAPSIDVDAVSFGEMSSDADSGNEDSPLPKSRNLNSRPDLESDGFEFSGPSVDNDSFEFVESYDDLPSSFESANAPYFSAEQGSVHTVYDEDEQPSAEHPNFERPPSSFTKRSSNHHKTKSSLGVLYCETCNKYFGNETVFKRHFMFGIKHGEQSRDMRNLYYRVWARTWQEEAKDLETRRAGSNVMDI
ncbi:hypothetical protein IQ07DRAFT_292495 [Pyrenochaeta sp. DS3sAY3a]|nr:hypothetical protein IQ07DRAFT_292495 [Pyrenochaeta sp. DS3sAY3a]